MHSVCWDCVRDPGVFVPGQADPAHFSPERKSFKNDHGVPCMWICVYVARHALAKKTADMQQSSATAARSS